MADLVARLAAQQRRVASLERSLAEVHAASAASNADDEHDPEGATIAFERQQLVSLLTAARATASALAAAVDRSRSGVPPLCSSCGRPIPEARLDARPQATTCIDCAR